jgi:tRNA (mo5U34)-methyltransferase
MPWKSRRARIARVTIHHPYESLPGRWPANDWLEALTARAQRRLEAHRHGDLPRWRAALAALPVVRTAADLDQAAPRLGEPAGDAEALRGSLMAFHPWRKGPLCLGGVTIDSEWRSDWKWGRIAEQVDLRGARVLDVGCGNGYYGLRMLGVGARLVVGIDPTVLYVMQWLACRHFAGDLPAYVLPIGVEDLPDGAPGFDMVFSLGVLYHRRDPQRHLQQLRGLLRAGGRLVLESLVLPSDRAGGLLRPNGGYARMRNVWAIPGTERLMGWLEQAEFRQPELIDQTATTTAEQRSTPWMRFESLREALHPATPGLTVEGHPAPLRALLLAQA